MRVPPPPMEKKGDPALRFTHNGGFVPTRQRDGKFPPVANAIPALILVPVRAYQTDWRKKRKETAKPSPAPRAQKLKAQLGPGPRAFPYP